MTAEKKVGGLRGTVVKKSGQKSVMVRVIRREKHPKYDKYVTKSTDIMAHDEEGKFEVGMYVLIEQSAPFSKRKSWLVSQLIEDRR